MKNFGDAMLDALERGDAIVTGAVAIYSDPAIFVWGGYGQLEFADLVFQGIGDRGLAQVSGKAVGGAAQGLALTLSGIEPEVLELLDADEVKRAPVIVWRIVFASDGRTLLGGHIFERGRIDKLPVSETVGGAATITALIESAARGLGRRGGRMRTDADQRLVKPTDGSMRNISHAGEKMLYWGGLKPSRAGSALGGITTGSAIGAREISTKRAN